MGQKDLSEKILFDYNGVFARIDTLKEFRVPDAEIPGRICTKFNMDEASAPKYSKKYQGC